MKSEIVFCHFHSVLNWMYGCPLPLKSHPSDGSRGQQGPRNGVGPSRQRRMERRAAKRAAATAVVDDTTEDVVETAKDSSVEDEKFL